MKKKFTILIVTISLIVFTFIVLMLVGDKIRQNYKKNIIPIVITRLNCNETIFKDSNGKVLQTYPLDETDPLAGCWVDVPLLVSGKKQTIFAYNLQETRRMSITVEQP